MGAIDHASFIALHQALLHILWNPFSFHSAVVSDARLLALALFLFPEEKRGDVAASRDKSSIDRVAYNGLTIHSIV